MKGFNKQLAVMSLKETPEDMIGSGDRKTSVCEEFQSHFKDSRISERLSESHYLQMEKHGTVENFVGVAKQQEIQEVANKPRKTLTDLQAFLIQVSSVTETPLKNTLVKNCHQWERGEARENVKVCLNTETLLKT